MNITYINYGITLNILLGFYLLSKINKINYVMDYNTNNNLTRIDNNISKINNKITIIDNNINNVMTIIKNLSSEKNISKKI